MRYVLTLVLLFGLLPGASAQTPETMQLGWKKSSTVGGNLSFSSSQDVVGQTDGNSETYGLNLKNTFTWVESRGEWKTESALVENTTRTPSLDRYTKSADEFKIGTSYVYFFERYPTFGPYVRAEAAAPLFKGENVQATDQNYRIRSRDGTSTLFTGSTLRLTDSLRPLTTKEAVGLFWRPHNDDNTKLEIRVGFAALQIAADGQLTVKGNNPAGEVEVEELKDVNQAGVEAAIQLKRKISDTSTFEFGLESMTPFINNQEDSDDREAIRLTNVDGFAKLNTKITKYADFSYDYKLKLQPQLVDRVQQIHLLALNLNYSLF